MSSNQKPKTPNKESPTEPFKRAVTGCLRAIAKKSDLEVTFAAERPGLFGGKVRLPEPARKLSREEAATDAKIVFSTADKNGDGYLDNSEYSNRDMSNDTSKPEKTPQ